MRAINFGAGPGALPRSVLERAREQLLETEGFAVRGRGLPVLEWSHRSEAYLRVHEGVRSRLRRLCGLDEEWEVLLLQGGASVHFAQVPLNLARAAWPGRYVLTGVWARKALEEARRLGRGNALASGEDTGFTRLPDEVSVRRALAEAGPTAYVHLTTNNTIHGTQWPEVPDLPGSAVVADASSDLLSRPFPRDRVSFVYAGAQKNLGPAGLGIVLARRELLERAAADVPAIWRYADHAARGSLLHTPPTFVVWMVGEVLSWLEGEGGPIALAARNERKAARIYEVLDGSPFWQPTAHPAHRSRMNVVFRLADPALEPEVVREAAEQGFVGLAGHRAVGGLRASLYNAISEQEAAALAAFLADFERRRG